MYSLFAILRMREHYTVSRHNSAVHGFDQNRFDTQNAVRNANGRLRVHNDSHDWRGNRRMVVTGEKAICVYKILNLLEKLYRLVVVTKTYSSMDVKKLICLVN